MYLWYHIFNSFNFEIPSIRYLEKPEGITIPVNSAKGQQDTWDIGEPNVPEGAEITGLIVFLKKRNLMWNLISTMNYLVRK